MPAEPSNLADLPTPSLVVDRAGFDHNVAAMAEALPGERLRPHVKAFKSTALAKELVAAGHHNFTCATIREMVGMADAGLGVDLLLANEVLDASRLTPAIEAGARITVAVDSVETVDAAAAAGVPEVLIDVNVGLPRCGVAPEGAGALAEYARGRGREVRGVMGYEGHLMMVLDEAEQRAEVEKSMQLLLAAHADVGGDVVSAGGTGTYKVNTWATEIQAGSYTLLDTDYGKREGPFRPALQVLCLVISTNPAQGYVVLDAGLKAFGMDHGNPTTDAGAVWFCSDEHTTMSPREGLALNVGDRVMLTPAHIDPTIARHEHLWVLDGDRVSDQWAVDLRHW